MGLLPSGCETVVEAFDWYYFEYSRASDSYIRKRMYDLVDICWQKRRRALNHKIAHLYPRLTRPT